MTEITTATVLRNPASGRPMGLNVALERTAGYWRQWQETRRTRRLLRALPDHLLWDIGLTRAEVEQEAAQPFWSLLDRGGLERRRQCNSRHSVEHRPWWLQSTTGERPAGTQLLDFADFRQDRGDFGRRPLAIPAWLQAPAAAIGHTLQSAWTGYRHHREARQTRRALLALDERALKDFGVARSEIAYLATHGASQNHPPRH